MKTDTQIVLFDTAEAATFQTGLSGWVSRQGTYCGKDEAHARYLGCTHRMCECGQIREKAYTVCEACREKAAIARYEALPRVQWDEEVPLYSESTHRFCYDYDDLWEACDGVLADLDNLRLVVCVGVRLHEIDDEEWSDELSNEDGYGDLPDAVGVALAALNEAVRAAGPVSWEPGTMAALVAWPDEYLEDGDG